MSKRKELLTHSEVCDDAKKLTNHLRHAKIDCGTLKKDSNVTIKDIQDKIKALEELQAAISEYRCELRDVEVELKDRQRDSGISVGDRSSVSSARDSIPIQECGDCSHLSTDLSNMAAAFPSEHDEKSDNNKKPNKMTTSEEEVLDRSGMVSIRNRRGIIGSQRVEIPEAIPEDSLKET